MSVAVKLNHYRLVKLLPYSNGLVVRPCHDEIGKIADSERPNFAVVALKLLDVLKLNRLGISLREYFRVCAAHALSPSQYFRSLSFPTVQK